MGRILALDYGMKRVGMAVTDPLQIIATSLETIHPSGLINYLKAYLNKENVETIIIGMPTRLDGTDTNITGAVKKIKILLQQTFPELNIESHDERFTSAIALKSMIASGTSKKDRRTKGNIDMVSATIILQSYMESRSLQTK